MPPHPLQLAALHALLDRLVPADEFPGAVAAGVTDYILRQLAGDCAGEATALSLGLTQLDFEAAARYGAENTFTALAITQQDALLADIEAGRAASAWPAEISAAAFFARLVDLAHEGYYADPANGGNRDSVAWRMIGYDPRLPEKPPTL